MKRDKMLQKWEITSKTKKVNHRERGQAPRFLGLQARQQSHQCNLFYHHSNNHIFQSPLSCLKTKLNNKKRSKTRKKFQFLIKRGWRRKRKRKRRNCCSNNNNSSNWTHLNQTSWTNQSNRLQQLTIQTATKPVSFLIQQGVRENPIHPLTLLIQATQ